MVRCFFPSQAEVLGKRVVVQHIPLGGLLEWKNPDHADNETQVERQPSEPLPSHAPFGLQTRVSSESPSGLSTGYTPLPACSIPTTMPQRSSVAPPPLRDLRAQRGLRLAGDPITPARLAVGPTASTRLRGSMGPPMKFNHDRTNFEGDGGQTETRDEVSN